MRVGDSGASHNTEEEEISKKVATWVKMEDLHIIVDFYACNCSVGNVMNFGSNAR